MILALLIAAALADVYTSHKLFKRGGVEINPLVSGLFGKRPSFAAMLAVKAVACAGIAYIAYDPLTLAGACVWAAAAAWNATR